MDSKAVLWHSGVEGIARIAIQKRINPIQVIIYMGFPKLLVEGKPLRIEELQMNVQKEFNYVNRKLNKLGNDQILITSLIWTSTREKRIIWSHMIKNSESPKSTFHDKQKTSLSNWLPLSNYKFFPWIPFWFHPNLLLLLPI